MMLPLYVSTQEAAFPEVLPSGGFGFCLDLDDLAPDRGVLEGW